MLWMFRYCVWVVLLASGLWAAEPVVDFNRDVRPILAANCLACHGPDAESRKADLRLDTFAGATADLDGIRALVPGKPDESELIYRVETDDADEVMPPPKTGHALAATEVATLRAWVAQGGAYAEHWGFVAPVKATLPEVQQADWGRHAVDRFILARLEAEGLAPSADVDRARWLRRVSLDVTGLPPSLSELDAFLADRSETAREAVVDRLLASQAYGEHWARMWLDLARYADTKGYEKDRHRDIWRYRDWVIAALNRDMPFDEFTRDQLAGDLLPERDAESVLATAFHRNTMTNDEGGTDNEEFRVAAVKDRVDTTIQVWMGLTMGCAKCHTHKYDPIEIEEYYAFYALFNQTQDADDEAPFWDTPTAEQAARLTALETEVAGLRKALATRPAGFVAAYAAWSARAAEVPAWTVLSPLAFVSQHGVTLDERANRILVAQGKAPARDTWTLDFDVPPGAPSTALRIEHFPKALGGGNWPDNNVAIRELTAELVESNGTVRALKLINPRATFEQRGWEIRKALDGDLNVGWGMSPKFKEPQVGVFDFAEPLPPGARLRLTLEQQYGQSLLLARSRFALSSRPAAELKPSLAVGGEEAFAREVFPATKAQYAALAKAEAGLAAVKKAVPKTPVMLERGAAQQRETRVHMRGNFLDPGATVAPGVLGRFGDFPDGAPTNRLGVAAWLMADENPLTARVLVNRVWARLFGVGLVETEEDFGSQGMMPTHPQLLDWLAVDVREQGWSVKQLVRDLVLSRTYAQSAAATPEQLAADPRNQLLGRGPRFRLSAETVRDQALFAAGLLTHKLGGPSVMPPQPSGIWKTTYSGENWKTATGPDRFRRGLYTYLKRTSPYPAMLTFDAGSGEVCQVRRIRTNTPLQALVTLNDTVYIEAAGALAKQMQAAGEGLDVQLTHGFRRLLIREPEAREIARLSELVATVRADLEDGTELLKAAGVSGVDPGLVAAANVLLNLDEAVMKP